MVKEKRKSKTESSKKVDEGLNRDLFPDGNPVNPHVIAQRSSICNSDCKRCGIFGNDSFLKGRLSISRRSNDYRLRRESFREIRGKSCIS